MNKNNKNKLYNSIMESVAKQVKKTLNENIFEDTRLYIIVEAYNKAYDYMLDYYADVMVSSQQGDPNIFIILKSNMHNIYNMVEAEDVKTYEIPDTYTSIDDFADDYTVGIITMEDLANHKLHENHNIKHNKKCINEGFESNVSINPDGKYRPWCQFIGIHEGNKVICWWDEDDVQGWVDDFAMTQEEVDEILNLKPGQSICVDGENTYIKIKD